MFDIIFPSFPVYLFHIAPSLLFVILQCGPFSLTSLLYFLLQITLSPFLFTLAAIALLTTLTSCPLLISPAFPSVYFSYHIPLCLINFCLPRPSIPLSLNCLPFTSANPASPFRLLFRTPPPPPAPPRERGEKRKKRARLFRYPFELLQISFN